MPRRKGLGTKDRDQELRDFYSSSAGGYEAMWAPELRHLAHPLLDELPLGATRTVLEVGAGVGALLRDIRARAPLAIIAASDGALGMLQRAPRDFPQVVMDAARPAVRPNSLDAVVAAFVLFHLSDPGDAVRAAHRCLRTGGHLATTTWGEDPPFRAYEIWEEELEKVGAAPHDPSFTNHEPVKSPAKMDHLLSSAGFEVIKIWTDWYRNTMSPAEFLQHRITHGVSLKRYESLDGPSRAKLRARVLARLERADERTLTDQTEVIYSIARKPT